jgi:membrane fusion protein (multidrug efflux system)
VERRALNPGSYVEGTTVLYRLVDNQRLELEALVASSDMSRLARGQGIEFTAAPFPERRFTARITHISAAVQTASRSVMVRAAVSNPGGLLRAGMFVKGRVIVGSQPNALKIPAVAVWRRSGRPPAVFVVEQNQARRRDVETGREEEDWVEIRSGLSPGDWVIAEQNLELADGVAVTIAQ